MEGHQRAIAKYLNKDPLTECNAPPYDHFLAVLKDRQAGKSYVSGNDAVWDLSRFPNVEYTDMVKQ